MKPATGVGGWLREAAGWGLVMFALYLLRQSALFVADLQEPRVVEAAVMTFGGLGVLRAGVFIIRLAAAARAMRME